jgi:hypothetical protein
MTEAGDTEAPMLDLTEVLFLVLMPGLLLSLGVFLGQKLSPYGGRLSD